MEALHPKVKRLLIWLDHGEGYKGHVILAAAASCAGCAAGPGAALQPAVAQFHAAACTEEL